MEFLVNDAILLTNDDSTILYLMLNGDLQDITILDN